VVRSFSPLDHRLLVFELDLDLVLIHENVGLGVLFAEADVDRVCVLQDLQEQQNAIVEFLKGRDAASVAEIIKGVTEQLGTVSESSIRSSLNLNVGTPGTLFERTGHGKYRLGIRPKD
jgi:hypothetical protein